jgi:hypothetical protein
VSAVQLYTSLLRLKMAMNGGTLPPMTPLTESAKKLIDPEFTIGMGALVEDSVKGLRCPVRGCGMYFHNLGCHVRGKHKSLGGVDAVRRALCIPKSIGLVSTRTRENLREARKLWGHEFRAFAGERAREMGRRGGRRASGVRQSLAMRNLRDQCDAQLSHKIIDLHNSLRRSPTATEFKNRYGATVMGAVVSVFGTWSNAKEQCGLEVYRPRRKIESADVLPAFQAWYKEHGDLPTSGEAIAPSRTPALPAYRTTLKAMKANTWPEAMERVASMLNIYGGRYGLPITKAS